MALQQNQWLTTLKGLVGRLTHLKSELSTIMVRLAWPIATYLCRASMLERTTTSSEGTHNGLFFRGAFQMAKNPHAIGGAAVLAGYFWSCLTRFEPAVSKGLVEFHRKEQLERLKTLIVNCLSWRG